jgi:hypothetical protein
MGATSGLQPGRITVGKWLEVFHRPRYPTD